MSRHLVKMWFLTEHLQSGKHFVTPRTAVHVQKDDRFFLLWTFTQRNDRKWSGKSSSFIYYIVQFIFEVFDKGSWRSLKNNKHFPPLVVSCCKCVSVYWVIDIFFWHSICSTTSSHTVCLCDKLSDTAIRSNISTSITGPVCALVLNETNTFRGEYTVRCDWPRFSMETRLSHLLTHVLCWQ